MHLMQTVDGLECPSSLAWAHSECSGVQIPEDAIYSIAKATMERGVTRRLLSNSYRQL